MIDVYSGEHSSGVTAAATAHQNAVAAFVAHRPVFEHLRSALAQDPQFTAAHALNGIAQALFGSEASMAVSRSLVTKTANALALSGGGTAHERALAMAHEAAAGGALSDAARYLEAHLQVHPTDLLSLKLAHALRFMSGEPQRMRETTSKVLPHWSADAAGYGYVLGCHAFALEETGELADAERFGRSAVAYEPDDVWGRHAVAHVLEMEGRTREGRLWLEPSRSGAFTCGAFNKHLVWHLALFHLAEEDHQAVLQLYDNAIAPSRDGDFRELANAVSLLWRLELCGVAVGSRWDEVAEIARTRRKDCAYAFAALHNLLAFIATGDTRAAEEVVAGLKDRASVGSQVSDAHSVGHQLAEWLLSAKERSCKRAELVLMARRLVHIGGSHAQRDVFLQSLMMIAATTGDSGSVAGLSAIRNRMRAEDKFQRTVWQRLRRGTLVVPRTPAARAAV